MKKTRGQKSCASVHVRIVVSKFELSLWDIVGAESITRFLKKCGPLSQNISERRHVKDLRYFVVVLLPSRRVFSAQDGARQKYNKNMSRTARKSAFCIYIF
jgi:hypothetical protein